MDHREMIVILQSERPNVPPRPGGHLRIVARTLARVSVAAPRQALEGAGEALLGEGHRLLAAQLARLVRQHRDTRGWSTRRDGNQGRPFPLVYRLLAQVDATSATTWKPRGGASAEATCVVPRGSVCRVKPHRLKGVGGRVAPHRARAALGTR